MEYAKQTVCDILCDLVNICSDRILGGTMELHEADDLELLV